MSKIKNYDIEMSYGVNVTMNIKAESQEEAIEKAKKLVNDGINITEDYRIDDVSELFFQDVTYIIEC